jgi:hypothetical protein
LFTGVIASFFNQQLFPLVSIFLIIKIIIDFPVIAGITIFSRQLRLLWLFIPLEIINIFYVPAIAVAGYFFKTKWKGRDIY